MARPEGAQQVSRINRAGRSCLSLLMYSSFVSRLLDSACNLSWNLLAVKGALPLLFGPWRTAEACEIDRSLARAVYSAYHADLFRLTRKG